MSRAARPRTRLVLLAALLMVAALPTQVSADVYYPPGIPDGATFTPPEDDGSPVATTICVRNAENTAGWGVATAASKVPAGTVVTLPYSVNLTKLEATKPSARSTRTSPTSARRVSNRFGPPCNNPDFKALTYCTTGYDVWRFYGSVHRDSTKSNPLGSTPVQAVSHSTVSFDAWCRPQYSRESWSKIALFSPDPADGPGSSAGNLGSLWSNDAENRRGESYALTAPAGANQAGFFTTHAATITKGTRSTCQDLASAPNPAIAVLSDPTQPEFQTRLTELRGFYDAWRSKHDRTLAARLANLDPTVNPNLLDAIPAGAFNEAPCDSGYEYAAASDTADLAVFGTCAVPTERLTTLWRDRNDDLIAGFPTVANSGGHRYQVPGLRTGTATRRPLFAPDAGRDPRLTQPVVPRTDAVWYHTAWRKAAAAEYRARRGNIGEDLPGDPYLAEAKDQRSTKQRMDRSRAASVIENYAVCGNGSYVANALSTSPCVPGDPDCPVLTPKPTMSVALTTSGTVFSVRADNKPHRITLTPTVTCTDCTTADEDTPAWYVSRFEAKLRITGTNGYFSRRADLPGWFKVAFPRGALWQNSRKLRTQAPDPATCGENCDLTEITLTATDLSAADLETLVANLTFYRATRNTSPPQKVRIDVLSLAATVATYIDPPVEVPLTLPDGTVLLDLDGDPVMVKRFVKTEVDVPSIALPGALIRSVVSGTVDPGR